MSTAIQRILTGASGATTSLNFNPTIDIVNIYPMNGKVAVDLNISGTISATDNHYPINPGDTLTVGLMNMSGISFRFFSAGSVTIIGDKIW